MFLHILVEYSNHLMTCALHNFKIRMLYFSVTNLVEKNEMGWACGAYG